MVNSQKVRMEPTAIIIQITYISVAVTICAVGRKEGGEGGRRVRREERRDEGSDEEGWRERRNRRMGGEKG